MKITIEPEIGENFEKKIYSEIYEFELIGTRWSLGIKPQRIVHTTGEIPILIGLAQELQERLRTHGSSPSQ